MRARGDETGRRSRGAAGAPPPPPKMSLGDARRGFQTKLVRQEKSGEHVPTPPSDIFRIVQYDSPIGKMPAYLSPDPEDGKKHPAIIWITGGIATRSARFGATRRPTTTRRPALSGRRESS